jgi:hypothetical protein
MNSAKAVGRSSRGNLLEKILKGDAMTRLEPWTKKHRLLDEIENRHKSEQEEQWTLDLTVRGP